MEYRDRIARLRERRRLEEYWRYEEEDEEPYRDGRGWPEGWAENGGHSETGHGRGAPRRRVHGGREPGSVPTWIHRAGVLPAGRLSPEADAQRGEEEEITEENVYDAYDETMPFFPDQILIEGFLCVLLLLIVTALSYLAPAPFDGACGHGHHHLRA